MHFEIASSPLPPSWWQVSLIIPFEVAYHGSAWASGWIPVVCKVQLTMFLMLVAADIQLQSTPIVMCQDFLKMSRTLFIVITMSFSVFRWGHGGAQEWTHQLVSQGDRVRNWQRGRIDGEENNRGKDHLPSSPSCKWGKIDTQGKGQGR